MCLPDITLFLMFIVRQNSTNLSSQLYFNLDYLSIILVYIRKFHCFVKSQIFAFPNPVFGLTFQACLYNNYSNYYFLNYTKVTMAEPL